MPANAVLDARNADGSEPNRLVLQAHARGDLRQATLRHRVRHPRKHCFAIRHLSEVVHAILQQFTATLQRGVESLGKVVIEHHARIGGCRRDGVRVERLDRGTQQPARVVPRHLVVHDRIGRDVLVHARVRVAQSLRATDREPVLRAIHERAARRGVVIRSRQERRHQSVWRAVADHRRDVVADLDRRVRRACDIRMPQRRSATVQAVDEPGRDDSIRGLVAAAVHEVRVGVRDIIRTVSIGCDPRNAVSLAAFRPEPRAVERLVRHNHGLREVERHRVDVARHAVVGHARQPVRKVGDGACGLRPVRSSERQHERQGSRVV